MKQSSTTVIAGKTVLMGASMYLLVCSSTFSQSASDRWMLEQLHQDRPIGAPISCQGQDCTMMFQPADSPIKGNNRCFHRENLVFTRAGLYFGLDGTGRIYQVQPQQEQQDDPFIREDATDGFGYNFGAYVFSYQDTIYSLGGYGYWSKNWNLRYFSKATKGWELLPLNKRIHVTRENRGLFLDSDHGLLFVPSEDSLKDEGLLSTSSPRAADSILFSLDLRTKRWKIEGKMTPRALNLIGKGIEVCSTPYGKLFIFDSKGRFSAYFMNGRTNQILELKDKELSTRIYHKLLDFKSVGVNLRTLSYFHNSILTILTSDKIAAHYQIKESDLRDTGDRVFIPIETRSHSTIGWAALLSVLEGLIIATLGILLIRKRRQDHNKATGSTGWADQRETQLLEEFLASEDKTLSTEQIDQVLGTGSKSIDLKNKRRSMIIKSLNRKFQETTEMEGFLIRSERMEKDRRMVRYVLDIDNYKLIENKVTER